MESDTLITHPNFKSLDPLVKDAETMDEYLGAALLYQRQLEKKTTPWEAQQWDYDALQEFEINLEKVDRLYHIDYEDIGCGRRCFEMIARMEYEDEQLLYVELQASCDFSEEGGFIFISKDANIFMKLVLAENDINRDPIYESLQEDSIYVEEEEDNTLHNKFARMMLRNVPMLKYLCHETIYDNRDVLRGYRSLLPNILIESLDDFIRTRDAWIAYDE